MWDLKSDTSELVYKTETDSQTENRRVVAKEGGAKVKTRMEKKQAPVVYHRDYIQYPMIDNNGKEYVK